MALVNTKKKWETGLKLETAFVPRLWKNIYSFPNIKNDTTGKALTPTSFLVSVLSMNKNPKFQVEKLRLASLVHKDALVHHDARPCASRTPGEGIRTQVL